MRALRIIFMFVLLCCSVSRSTIPSPVRTRSVQMPVQGYGSPGVRPSGGTIVDAVSTRSLTEFSDKIASRDFGSVLILIPEASKTQNIGNSIAQQDGVSNLHHTGLRREVADDRIRAMAPFDNDNIEYCCERDIEQAIASLIPQELIDMHTLVEDIGDLMRAALLFKHSSPVVARLALLEGVRCPKWHEDYVYARLVKTYVGVGTEFADPTSASIRIANKMRSTLGQDLYVAPEDVIPTRQDEAMLMAGRYYSGKTPVLHRSPIVDEQCKRLLFSLTLP
jgi:Protein of unknown function (DUF1826)